MNAVVAVLLAIACVAVAISAFGLLLARDISRRLLAPAATVGVVAVAAAIVVREALGEAGIKAILAGVILFAMTPVLSRAIARAAGGNAREEEPQ